MSDGATLQIVLLGPPGAGKGTQAALLVRKLGIPHVSTGEILRGEITRGTERGDQARVFMEQGRLVPDELVLDLVRGRLASSDCEQGFLLDGFPRSTIQAEELCRMIAGRTKRFMAASIVVSDEEIVRRLAGRRTCTSCGAIFHLEFEPPRQPDACDKCGGALVQREDDREEVIQRRLRIYRRDTEPLLDYYRAKNRLLEVGGQASVEAVQSQLLAGLGLRS